MGNDESICLGCGRPTFEWCDRILSRVKSYIHPREYTLICLRFVNILNIGCGGDHHSITYDTNTIDNDGAHYLIEQINTQDNKYEYIYSIENDGSQSSWCYALWPQKFKLSMATGWCSVFARLYQLFIRIVVLLFVLFTHFVFVRRQWS